MIFDSDVVIWMLRGHPQALRFARAVEPGECNLSVVTYLEILRGCRDRSEARDLVELIEGWFSEILPLTPEISASAISLMRQFALSHRPDVQDILIAATALGRSEIVTTANVRHFRIIPGLKVREFRP